MRRKTETTLLLITLLFSINNTSFTRHNDNIALLAAEISPPLVVNFNTSLFSKNSFNVNSKNQKKTDIKKRISQRQKELRKKKVTTWYDAVIYLDLAQLYSDENNFAQSNKYLEKAEKLLIEELTKNKKNRKAIELISKVFYTIITNNSNNRKLIKTYINIAIKTNKMAALKDTTGEAYYRLGILFFNILQNPAKGNYYFLKALEKQPDNFEYSFLAEFTSFYSFFMKRKLNDLKKAFTNKSIINAIDFQRLRLAIKKHPSDMRYKILLRTLQLYALFFKCGIIAKDDLYNFKVKLTCFTYDEKMIIDKITQTLQAADSQNTVRKSDLYPLLGMVFFLRHDLKQTTDYLAKAFTLNPGDEKLMSVLIYLYLRKSNLPKKALAVIQKKMSTNPAPLDHLWLATVYYMQKKYNKALNACNNVIRNKSETLNAHLLYAMILFRLEQYKQAHKTALYVEQNKKTNWMFDENLYITLSAINLAQKNNKKAYHYIQKALENNKDNKKLKKIIKKIFNK